MPRMNVIKVNSDLPGESSRYLLGMISGPSILRPN